MLVRLDNLERETERERETGDVGVILREVPVW